MTLVLELTRDEEDRLRERAARRGQDVLEYTLGLVREGMRTEEPAPAKKHSVMEFYGIGRDALRGLDVDAYIREMRDEWDAPEDDH